MHQMVKLTLSGSLAAALLLVLPVSQAQPYGGYPGWRGGPPAGNFVPGAYPWIPGAEQESPAGLLREGIEQLTQFLETRPNGEALAAYLEQKVAPWFDFDYMAEWAAGRRFERLDEARQAELRIRLKQSFLETMAQKLARYSQQRATFLPAQPDAPGMVTLPIAIENPAGGYPARLEFRVRKSEQGWKVVDVAANGSSALMYYRQTLNEMLRPRPPMMAPPVRPY